MTIINSSELQENLFSDLEQIPDGVHCLKDWIVWTGFSDERDEGNFTDSNEGISM